ncbi:hypothetical protein INT48_009718 [Thamnidium elegans]|uniref:Uncharacterized protein n=1 Tax=Thamnidium elegans TaxID=101142 RepID=A0A8H7SVE5_9FUNG|nr:hypothetical protein INT48_009718 [Thamnidium elegans]
MPLTYTTDETCGPNIPSKKGKLWGVFYLINNRVVLFIESSGAILQENINHTLEDTLKLLVECNGTLCYILSHFKNSRFHIIKDTITLSEINLKEDGLWKFVKLRFAGIPTIVD